VNIVLTGIWACTTGGGASQRCWGMLGHTVVQVIYFFEERYRQWTCKYAEVVDPTEPEAPVGVMFIF